MIKKILILALLSSAFNYSQTFLGGTSFGGSSIDNSQALHLDKDNNIYIGGLFSGSITLGSTTITHNGGNADGYLAKFNSSGVAQWIKKFGSPADDIVRAIASDTSGNLFVTGYFQGNAFDADPDPNTTSILAQPAPILSRDCFIVKLDINGNFVWAKQISNSTGGAANEDSYDIKCDSDGNVYVAGRFSYADFDTSSGINDVQSYGSNFNTDGFILKLNSLGNTVWVKQFGSSTHDIITSIDIDSSNNIYATGIFTGTADFDPSATNNTNSVSAGNNDVFIVKIDSNGNYLMHKTFGGSGTDYANSIKVDSNGNIYTVGYFSNTVDFDPSTTIASSSSLGAWDCFLLKLDASGNYINHQTIGSSANDQFYSIDVNDNRILVAGIYGQTIDLDAGANTINVSLLGGSSDIFVLELNNSLSYVNHYLFQSTGTNNLPWISTNGDEAILAGSFQNTLDLDPTAGVFNVSASNYDVFLSRFTPTLLSNNSFEEQTIFVYPNPFTNKLFIENNTYINFEIYSILGTQVNKGVIMNNVLNLSTLDKGIYFLRLIEGNNSTVFKIVRE